MFLKNVTITGFDGNTHIPDVVELTKKYPFVEWGILISSTRNGTVKYPDKMFVGELMRYAGSKGINISLSYHLCGRIASDFAKGYFDVDLWRTFVPPTYFAKRIQVNINATKTPCDYEKFAEKINLMMIQNNIPVIIQFNKANELLWYYLVRYEAYPNILFDASGGRGKVIRKFLPPVSGFFCGYAGGLNPDNVVEALEYIDCVINDGVSWVDTESGVRDKNDQLDLNKVDDFLSKCKKWVIS